MSFNHSVESDSFVTCNSSESLKSDIFCATAYAKRISINSDDSDIIKRLSSSIPQENLSSHETPLRKHHFKPTNLLGQNLLKTNKKNKNRCLNNNKTKIANFKNENILCNAGTFGNMEFENLYDPYSNKTGTNFKNINELPLQENKSLQVNKPKNLALDVKEEKSLFLQNNKQPSILKLPNCKILLQNISSSSFKNTKYNIDNLKSIENIDKNINSNNDKIDNTVQLCVIKTQQNLSLFETPLKKHHLKPKNMLSQNLLKTNLSNCQKKKLNKFSNVISFEKITFLNSDETQTLETSTPFSDFEEIPSINFKSNINCRPKKLHLDIEDKNIKDELLLLNECSPIIGISNFKNAVVTSPNSPFIGSNNVLKSNNMAVKINTINDDLYKTIVNRNQSNVKKNDEKNGNKTNSKLKSKLIESKYNLRNKHQNNILSKEECQKSKRNKNIKNMVTKVKNSELVSKVVFVDSSNEMDGKKKKVPTATLR